MSAKDSAGDKLIDSIRKTKAQAAAGSDNPANPESRPAPKKKAGKKAAAKTTTTKNSAAIKSTTTKAVSENSRAEGGAKRSFASNKSQLEDLFQRGRRVWPD